jgi:ribosomal protein L32E
VGSGAYSIEFAYNDSPNKSIWMSTFQILYGMHPRGVFELRNLGKQELRSVDGEDFAVSIARTIGKSQVEIAGKKQQVQTERRHDKKTSGV